MPIPNLSHYCCSCNNVTTLIVSCTLHTHWLFFCFKHEVFSSVLSMDTWSNVLEEGDRNRLRELLPKQDGGSQSEEDILQWVLYFDNDRMLLCFWWCISFKWRCMWSCAWSCDVVYLFIWCTVDTLILGRLYCCICYHAHLKYFIAACLSFACLCLSMCLFACLCLSFACLSVCLQISFFRR